jgi:hypothetical protein
MTSRSGRSMKDSGNPFRKTVGEAPDPNLSNMFFHLLWVFSDETRNLKISPEARFLLCLSKPVLKISLSDRNIRY